MEKGIMKKLLFWVTFPFMFIVVLVFSWAAEILEWIAVKLHKACHQWEEWCYDWKDMYPDMDYRGDGIWYSRSKDSK